MKFPFRNLSSTYKRIFLLLFAPVVLLPLFVAILSMLFNYPRNSLLVISAIILLMAPSLVAKYCGFPAALDSKIRRVHLSTALTTVYVAGMCLWIGIRTAQWIAQDDDSMLTTLGMLPIIAVSLNVILYTVIAMENVSTIGGENPR